MKKKLSDELWRRDAAVRRELERRIAEVEARKPPDERLQLPPR